MTNLRHVGAALVMTIMAIAYAGGTVEAAPAAKEFMLVNAQTGKCLTIAGGTLSDNNIVAVQFDCDGDPSRRWRLDNTRSEIYQIRNVKTGKCLTIAGGVSNENNVRALQFDCDNHPSRTWRLSKVSGGGSYQIRNVQTDKCLTIAGGTLSDNNIESVQFDCDDDTSRRWNIKTVSGVSPQSQPSGGAPPAPTYRTSEWSKWSRTEGIEYRYRWGWSPQNSRQIDAIYAIRNLQNRVWYGTARTHCSGNELARSEQVALQPNQLREVKFKTPHCGTTDKPWFEPKIVQSSTL